MKKLEHQFKSEIVKLETNLEKKLETTSKELEKKLEKKLETTSNKLEELERKFDRKFEEILKILKPE